MKRRPKVTPKPRAVLGAWPIPQVATLITLTRISPKGGPIYRDGEPLSPKRREKAGARVARASLTVWLNTSAAKIGASA